MKTSFYMSKNLHVNDFKIWEYCYKTWFLSLEPFLHYFAMIYSNKHSSRLNLNLTQERGTESEKLLYGNGVFNKEFNHQSKRVTGYVNFSSVMLPLFYEILLSHSNLECFHLWPRHPTHRAFQQFRLLCLACV